MGQYTRKSQGLPFSNASATNDNHTLPFLFPGSKRYVHNMHWHQVLISRNYQKDRIPAQTDDSVNSHDDINSRNKKAGINPLKTKRRLLYLKTQFVPRSKHFSTRL